jgi:hypothetical protein
MLPIDIVVYRLVKYSKKTQYMKQKNTTGTLGIKALGVGSNRLSSLAKQFQAGTIN